MPTPVNVARQCLTEEAARALEEAVAVARRRSHAQTTSLHAVSALLAPPSSALRDACARAKSRAYSSRLQFRALDLSVGVSLDRLPSAKTVDEPPVANSLMAAIKRSQANQRRHPDNFHLQQIHYNQQPASVLKVELKYLILSILDDPIVNRVFGEAGFQSRDIKIAIAHPPITQIARFSRAAPMFLCNLTESSSPLGSSRPGFAFPFSNFNFNDVDENWRVISETLMRAKGNGRNSVLIGVSADECLKRFIECVNEGDKGGVLPRELSGLSVISIESEIKEFVFEGGGAGEGMMLGKFEELEKEVERCSGPGILVNFGDLGMLVGENLRNDLVSSLVMKLTGLLEGSKEKLWFIGTAVNGDVYSKFSGRYPSVEKDWDLRLQPVSYSRKPSLGSNSSLMGSFVPFGGFFSDDFKNPSSSIPQSISRCHLCTAKYEQDVSDILNTGSAVSVADQDSESIPCWLSRKGLDVAKTKDDGTALNVKILGLKRKWNDICQRHHHVQPFLQLDNLQPRPQVSISKGFQYDPHRKETNSGSSRDSTLNQSQSANLRPGFKVDLQKEIPSSVTTDLGLGTLYSSKPRELSAPKSREPEVVDAGSERFSGSDSSQHGTVCENTSRRMAQSPLCSASSGGQFDSDSKLVRRALAEKVNWQDGAVSAISEIISSYKAGCRGPQGLWLSFLGPDKVGKKKLALALAEMMFGSIDCLVSVDLSPVESNYDSRATMVVDRLASELSKRPRLVVFLEDVDKADPVTQSSLSQAIRMGKFRDSFGRETRINNVIFVAATTMTMGNTSFLSGEDSVKFPEESISGEDSVKFPEERILGCKSRQMRILIEQVAPHASPNSVTASMKITSSSTLSAKRIKMEGTYGRKEQETSSEDTNQAYNASRTCLDLNLPLEEAEDTDSGSENSQAWLDDFLSQVHKKVVFKPVDFDALAEKMAKEIFTQFHRAFGSEIQLEIDEEVLVELLSAYWLLDQKGIVEDWIRNVLGGGFAEARQKCQISAQCVVKLVSCKGISVEQQAPEVGLPSRINL